MVAGYVAKSGISAMPHSGIECAGATALPQGGGQAMQPGPTAPGPPTSTALGGHAPAFVRRWPVALLAAASCTSSTSTRQEAALIIVLFRWRPLGR